MILAWHTLIDFNNCDPAKLADAQGIRIALVDAIASAGGTYVTDVFHEFSPHGLSGVIVIAESHVALHTWPEFQFAALDIFSCTKALDQELIISQLAAWFETEARHVQYHERGGNTRP